MNIPKTDLKRIVIIGGGFGGLHLAKGLKNKNFQVVLIDKNNYHTFQPLLYQVASSGLEPDSIAYPLRKTFKNQARFHFRMAEVIEIKSNENILLTSVGELFYDYLVLATGTTTNFFGNNEIAKYAMTMKSVSEALDLRSVILQNFEKALITNEAEKEGLLNFAIVGGGPTGVELAGALAELKRYILPSDYPDLDIKKMNIYLIEAQDEILAAMRTKSSEKALLFLKKLGVEVLLKKMVDMYDGDTLVFKDGESLKTKTLIWAAGVKANLVNGINNDSLKNNRYEVNRNCLIKNYSNIYAIGDVALMETKCFPKGLPQLAPVANQQGSYLANYFETINNDKTKKSFEYKDLGVMATVGRNKAVVEMGKLNFQGIFAWFVWMFVHLMSLVGFRNKVITLFNWVYSYVSFDKGARLIIRKYKK